MRTINNCRSCGSFKLSEVIDLGEQYLSDFRPDDEKPPKYPLKAVICQECMLVQLEHTVPSHEMYHDRYGFKSGISDSIKADLKDVVDQTLAIMPYADSWLDIASNDGTLLSYVPKEIYRVGNDPITPLCEEAEQHADRIVNDFFKASYHPYSYDVITSISMFYDLDDPVQFVKEVESVLAENGIWVIQQNYLFFTMQLGAIDNFCHEHLEYYTLMSLDDLLDRCGLEVFKVQTSMVNGGSIRTFVARKGDYPIDESVRRQRRVELEYELDRIEPYEEFAAKALKNVAEMSDLVRTYAASGSSVYIMAASTRGATIWQAAGFGPEQITAAVERNPAKVGKMFSAIGVPIISEEQARAEDPDYILIGPWFFADEIVEREAGMLEKGTKAIIPLPELRVV